MEASGHGLIWGVSWHLMEGLGKIIKTAVTIGGHWGDIWIRDPQDENHDSQLLDRYVCCHDTSSTLGKHWPIWSHSLPQKILPDCIRFSLRWRYSNLPPQRNISMTDNCVHLFPDRILREFPSLGVVCAWLITSRRRVGLCVGWVAGRRYLCHGHASSSTVAAGREIVL
jgi:hypothetical protein